MPNQLNIPQGLFLSFRDISTLFGYSHLNLIKMQIPTVDSIEVVLALTVGLATIGVCVFCAFTSVGALFI